MPVKLSNELVELAREEARAADRSITAQIEHWAKLGRSVESALRHEDAVALKASGGDLRRAFPGPSREEIHALLQRVAEGADRAELAKSLRQGRVVYQSDRSDSGAIERIEPDGTRTPGRIQDRRFIASRRRGRAGR